MCADRASVHTGNTGSETISVPEQDSDAPLLKAERLISDWFLNRLDLI